MWHLIHARPARDACCWPRYYLGMTDGLDFVDGDLPDDDPAIVTGMARLAVLRAAEEDVPTIPRR